MEKVKAGLRGLNPLEKATRAANVFKSMNGNPNFPDPTPSMAEFHAAYLELKRANLAAMDRGRRAIFERNQAVERINDYLSRLASYVNSVSQGDVEKLVTSGFFLVKRAEPINSLKQPMNLTVRATAYPGQVKVRWENVPGAIIYQVERLVKEIDGTEQWERVVLSSRPKAVIGGLTSYVDQQFRVCAVGTKTQSPYSNVAYGKAA